MLTPSHRLEGEPCGMRQLFEAAVSWSYDSPAKGGLHHAHYPGRVANRMDLLKWTNRAAAPVCAIMLCGSNSARAAASQSQIPLPMRMNTKRRCSFWRWQRSRKITNRERWAEHGEKKQERNGCGTLAALSVKELKYRLIQRRAFEVYPHMMPVIQSRFFKRSAVDDILRISGKECADTRTNYNRM